jgi:hypothetical protein
MNDVMISGTVHKDRIFTNGVCKGGDGVATENPAPAVVTVASGAWPAAGYRGRRTDGTSEASS